MCVIAGCSSKGGGAVKKGVLSGVEDCCAVFYDNEDQDYSSAMDQFKTKIEEFLKAKIGTEIPTTATAASGIVIDAPFTITDAEGFVGKSNGAPFMKMEAKASNISTKEVGIIGRDGAGNPVLCAKINAADGSLYSAVRFDIVYPRDYGFQVHKALGSVASIEVMSDAEYTDHVIYNSGPSYNFRGVAQVKLGGKADNVPESVPGIYNKKEVVTSVIEGPEEDFTVYTLVLSQDDKKVAEVSYDDYSGDIYGITVTSPEMFLPHKYYSANHSSAALLALSCASSPVLVAYSGAKTYVSNDPDTLLELPVLGMSLARFWGFEVEGWQPYGNTSFEKSSIVPDSQITKVTIRERYY